MVIRLLLGNVDFDGEGKVISFGGDSWKFVGTRYFQSTLPMFCELILHPPEGAIFIEACDVPKFGSTSVIVANIAVHVFQCFLLNILRGKVQVAQVFIT